MAGMLKNIFNRRFLHYKAAVHNNNTVAQLRHNAQVMGNENNAGAVLLFKLPQLAQDLILDRHVQGGGRLICDQKLRLVGKGHRDHDTLTHTA